MNSMTGYGFKEALVSDTQISVEIKSVNGRFLDLSINLPPFLSQLETRVRARVAERIVRGKVDVTVRVRDAGGAAVVTANPAVAVAYRDAIAEIARALGRDDSDIPLSLIIQQEGVLSVAHRYDAEALWQDIEGVLDEVLAQFIADRAREGAVLERDMLSQLDVLDRAAAFFKAWQPTMEMRFKETVTARFNELLGDRADENRIMQETAALLVRYTINEEIVRLHSHLAALRSACTGGDGEAPGRRIDFICQEANREINTIGSKNQFIEVGAMVVAAKDALENIREQAKNVE